MEIELVHIFIKVIKYGGFSKAAVALGLPKSTVSKAVTRLENTTGTKLLIRTTRSQTLTAAGKAFYDSCVGPIQAIEDAQKSLSGNDSLLTGHLKITAPEDLGTEVLAPAAGVLMQKYPGLHFELIYTDQILDLVKDGYDLAIRIGYPKESGLKIKKVGEVSLVLVASTKYLKTYGKVQKPEDLKNHLCLSLTSRNSKYQWNLKSSSSSAQVNIEPRLISNQMSSLIKAALVHSGIALVPAYLAKSYIESGDLIRVLPQWTSHGFPVSLLSPLAFSSSARLRTTTDYFMTEIKKALDAD